MKNSKCTLRQQAFGAESTSGKAKPKFQLSGDKSACLQEENLKTNLIGLESGLLSTASTISEGCAPLPFCKDSTNASINCGSETGSVLITFLYLGLRRQS